MKRVSELAKQEIFLFKLISNKLGCIVVNERLGYDYFFGKVAEDNSIADISNLAYTRGTLYKRQVELIKKELKE